ncbi:MAG: ankyrin repeat domain-containing protein [Gammaproteobacteria bacterium]|nr:ankyrin repeat domain-containing protein [Gammaproteobacteria bacterium]
MSLSRDLLEKNLERVKYRLSLGAAVNDFDEYGYTPLIIAIMTEQVEAASYLLEHGADSNRADLFGQPPLHWAIKVESVALCELLLKRQAFPNTVSSYGEPLLVYPLLKKNQELINLLTRYGTDRTCAQDYIFKKYLGHHFSLSGYATFKNYNLLISLVDYQGFRLEFAINQIARQFETYTSLYPDLIKNYKRIQDILYRADRLRQLKKAIPSEQEAAFINFISDINFLPLAFDGHAVSLVHTQRYAITCDRAQGRPATTTLYALSRPLSSSEISYLLYGKKDRRFWEKLPSHLNWNILATIPIPTQIVGNCSWANLEPAPILIDFLMNYETTSMPTIPVHEIANAYNTWSEWSKNFLLQEALIKSNELKDDRRTSLLLTLFDIFIQHPNTLPKWGELDALLSKESNLFQAIGYQHQISKSQWWPKIAKWFDKNRWKAIDRLE